MEWILDLSVLGYVEPTLLGCSKLRSQRNPHTNVQCTEIISHHLLSDSVLSKADSGLRAHLVNFAPTFMLPKNQRRLCVVVARDVGMERMFDLLAIRIRYHSGLRVLLGRTQRASVSSKSTHQRTIISHHLST